MLILFYPLLFFCHFEMVIFIKGVFIFHQSLGGIALTVNCYSTNNLSLFSLKNLYQYLI